MKSYIAALCLVCFFMVAAFVAGQSYQNRTRATYQLNAGPSYYLHGTGAHTAYIATPERLLVVILPDGKQLELTRKQIEEHAR